MAQDYIKVQLSGSTNGRGIALGTATTGTSIHATATTASTIDEMWISLINTATGSRTATIMRGGTTNADKTIVDIPPRAGWYVVINGLCLNGGSLSTLAYASATGVVAAGYVNRIESA